LKPIFPSFAPASLFLPPAQYQDHHKSIQSLLKTSLDQLQAAAAKLSNNMAARSHHCPTSYPSFAYYDREQMRAQLRCDVLGPPPSLSLDIPHALVDQFGYGSGYGGWGAMRND
jgi:hypothetical protein